jgi:hypothetical protein
MDLKKPQGLIDFQNPFKDLKKDSTNTDEVNKPTIPEKK